MPDKCLGTGEHFVHIPGHLTIDQPSGVKTVPGRGAEGGVFFEIGYVLCRLVSSRCDEEDCSHYKGRRTRCDTARGYAQDVSFRSDGSALENEGPTLSVCPARAYRVHSDPSLMFFWDDMKYLVSLFLKHEVQFAVCGGFAVAHYGYVRATMGFDLLVAPDEENAKKIMAALTDFGFGDAGISEAIFCSAGTAVTLKQSSRACCAEPSVCSTGLGSVHLISYSFRVFFGKARTV